MASEFNPKRFTFTVIKKDPDPLKSVILKEGITSDFTIEEVRSNIIKLKKMMEETESKVNIEKARMINIERDMPEIKDISPELLQIYYIYQRAKSVVSESEEHLTRVKDAIDEEQANLREIEVQTGIDMSKLFTEITTKVERKNENGNQSTN